METPSPEIRRAFYEHLITGLALWGMSEADVAWPNMLFKPVPERMYLRPWCLFNETTPASLSAIGYERLQGIFQISVFGVFNTGEGRLEELVRAVTDHFRGGLVMQMPCFLPVLITSCWRGSLQNVADAGQGGVSRPMIPVSARWIQYTPKGD